MQGALEMLCGGVLPLLLLVAGGCFAVWLLPTFRLRRGGEGRGSAGALAVALAGTLGVGNIAGVATALLLGGAGAIFWMWVSALFAMLLKYAEVVLAVRFRVRLADGSVRGGAYYYMKRAFTGQLGRALGALFAVLCVLCSLLLGGVIVASEGIMIGSPFTTVTSLLILPPRGPTTPY